MLKAALDHERRKREKARTWKQRPEVLCQPTIPEPLHGVVPRRILGNKWWNATRKAAYASTEFHCIACGVHKTNAKSRKWLEGHECYTINYKIGKMFYKETVPLCHYCHAYIHVGRLQMLLEEGKIHHAKFVAIVTHGDAVLLEYGLDKTVYDGPVATWDNWRLVLFGREYKPLDCQ